MKKLLILTMLITGFAHADDSEQRINDLTKMLSQDSYSKNDVFGGGSGVDSTIKSRNCSAVSRFAESSFKARQNGVSAEAMYSAIETENPEIRKVMELVIADTFRHPVKYTGKQLNSIASEYRDKFYIECMR